MILPPYVATYATHAPYITVNEYLASPTGVDTSNLVPTGGNLTNAQTLANTVLRASGWADSLCSQKLAATVDTRAGKFPVRNGQVTIPLPFAPVVMVSSISMGWTPSTISVLPSTSTADVWVDPDNTLTLPLPNLSYGNPDRYYFGGRDVYASVQYVNGWANTQLSATATAGATTLTVASGLGIVAGQQLALYSMTAGEVVTVAPGYVPSVATGPVSVPLVSGTQGAYASGDTLTCMPQEIKQAVIYLTSVLIKTRGAESLTMRSAGGGPMESDHLEGGALNDFEFAVDLLAPYKRVGA